MATPLERKPTVKQKVGHLRVDEQGEITYKKTPSSTLMASLQLGLSHSIGSLEPKPRRDILMTDFDVIETVEFPNNGSDFSPAHKYKDFTFTTYSPVAFRFFREAFQIKAEDYLLALCNQPMRELSNPGASGSLFYVSADDEFIIKTVQKKEAKFLQKLLPGYYLNLTQNKKTLLPKFFGLYQYRCGGIKIRIVVMNNLLPSSINYHFKFDLKGSTYKRRASPKEREKASPTYKDLDYRLLLGEGVTLSPERYDILSRTLQRDCQVLESFGIMDYSLLLGIHVVDETAKADPPPVSPLDVTSDSAILSPALDDEGKRESGLLKPVPSRIEARKNFSIMADELLDPDIEPGEVPSSYYPDGYIMARTEQGDKMLLYLGVIDILQSYKFKKKVEHSFKSFITDGDTVSVHNPSYYSARFQTFMSAEVFKKEKVRIRPRRNSTPYKGGGSRKISTHRTPTRERISRDSDVARPYSGPNESPVHLPPITGSTSRQNESPVHLPPITDSTSRQKSPPIKEEEIEINILEGTDSTQRQSGNIDRIPLEMSSDILTENVKDGDVEIKTSVTVIIPDNSSRNAKDIETPVLISSTD